MDGKRLEKVARLIQKDMGEILQKEAKNWFEGAMITVTKVRVSPDLSVARLYVSIFALNGKKPQEILILLEEKKIQLRMNLAQRVRHQLRIVPNISFFIDDSLDYMEKIDTLLKE